MGTIFEELIRKFNEENNEEAGEHWTPRDVVELMADLIFMPIADQIKDATYSCYDGACGTGGMLTVAQDRLMTLAARRGKNVSIHLFGQEINPETYAICKADMLLKGDGDQAEHISYGSTLSLDGNATRQFDFMLSNPPYGKSWKTDAEKMGGKKEILDSRFNAYLDGGEQLTMIPRTSDGQLLFLLNNVAKMKKDTPLGSRIAEVHNGSSIFTGDAGSGESNARRYMIENDLVEAIIAVPENMFYNTGIGTFIWVLSNKKEERRKGKIQLIDATAMKSALRKNMGKKNCEFTEEIRKEIVRIFLAMEESEVSIILNNEDFGYWNVTVERPLRLRVYPDRAIPADTFKKSDEYDSVIAAIEKAGKCDEDGDYTKLRWYAVILVQWMEGKGLNYIMRRAVEYQERHPEKFWINRYTKQYYDKNSLEHRNIVFANTLEVIENVILFSISNYFLRFSNEYKRVHGEKSLNRNNWYEYVEYGTTNEVTIQLQRYGFSRESATYIKAHPQYFTVDGEGNVHVKNDLENCGDNEVVQQIPDIRFNTPELFVE